ncbi:cell division topological specificity factor MinE [Vibrio algivorus]|uniref:Cell division topological specificity factor n=1 Tax=Vibrio algivorus TaxID=1667024 RepID=A0A557PAL7_9VIBR|nr:cell division topological specificity factor MinE [Vibrio algivorus]TVO37689.1 cell division topological specificity factor MinE [Vibrio algivorus]
MSLLQFFRPKKKDTANLAKERLQIIVAERRNQGSANPSYLPQLKEDILQVLSKYVSVDPSMVNVNLEQGDDDLSVLELNIQLPEKEE